MIQETLLASSVVFKDEHVLLRDYIPDKLLFREEYATRIAQNFRLLFDHKKVRTFATNILVVGEKGSGTSSLVRFTLAQLHGIAKSHKKDIRTYYQNCWYERQPLHILKNMFQNVFNEKNTDTDVSQVVYSLVTKLKKLKSHLIIVLDEAWSLATTDLRQLLALAENNPISYIVVMHPRDVTINFSDDLNNRFNDVITVPKYKYEEMHAILLNRCELAFYPGFYLSEMIEEIAAICYENHNLSIGVEILHQVGKTCDREKRDVVTHKIFFKVINAIHPQFTARTNNIEQDMPEIHF